MEEIIVEKIVEEIPNVWDIADLPSCKKYECPKCQTKIGYHPKYIEAEVAGCSRCEKIEEICKRMLKYRNYEFISIEKVGEQYVIKYKCPRGHIYEQKWLALREGRGCIECSREEKKRKKDKKDKKNSKQSCNCKELGKATLCGRSYACEHYNFAIMCPNGMKNWCYDRNTDIDPYKIVPFSRTQAFFRCEQYNQIYPKRVCDVYNTDGACPFCDGNEICKENSLYTTHPHVAKTWHPENEVKPWEVLAGSRDEMMWLCDNNIPTHEYSRKIAKQTLLNGRCPMCADGYDQKVGGHEEFVRAAREIHGNKYEYPDKFITTDKRINIYCTVISKETGLVHGLFLQKPHSHKRGHGCTKCNNEATLSIGASKIKTILLKWNFVEEKDFILEHRLEGLVYIRDLRLDFYIKEKTFGNQYPIAIEYDHEQHFADHVKNWGDSDETRKRDLRKDLFCTQNKIHLIRIPYTDDITEDYLATLLNKCKTDRICYFSYKHYQEEVKKKVDLKDVIVVTVSLPNKYNDIKCNFED